MTLTVLQQVQLQQVLQQVQQLRGVQLRKQLRHLVRRQEQRQRCLQLLVRHCSKAGLFDVE